MQKNIFLSNFLSGKIFLLLEVHFEMNFNQFVFYFLLSAFYFINSLFCIHNRGRMSAFGMDYVTFAPVE